MNGTKQTAPTRDELAALSRKLQDAPAVTNSAQAALWQAIGAADGWAAMSADDKAAFLSKFSVVQ